MSTSIENLTIIVERIIIELIRDNRYSHQLARANQIIHNRMNTTNNKSTEIELVIRDLKLIDNYIDYLRSHEGIDLELYLSIVIYFANILILSCNGVWIIDEDRDADRYPLGIKCSLFILIYGSCIHLSPHHLVMNNLCSQDASKLNELVSSTILSVNLEIEDIKNNYYPKYPLSGLEKLLTEGGEFTSESTSLISKLSSVSNIPLKKLNKSLSSLNSIDTFIRHDGNDFLYDTDSFNENYFLALVVYVGEVIIKKVNGRWIMSITKINLGGDIKYRWTLNILNSRNEYLKFFVKDMCNMLGEYTHTQSNIKRLVETYINADKTQDKFTWYKMSKELEVFS
jgi:hypothetical protein